MEILNKKTVLECKFNSEQEAENHDKIMLKDGWSIISKKNVFIKHYRSYSKLVREGVFL